MKIHRYLGLCALVLLPASVHAAASIGVNFGNTSTSATLAATDSAGAAPYAQTNYNNITARGTNLALKDNGGTTTTALLTFNSNADLTALTGTAAGANEVLNNGLDAGDASASANGLLSFTLGNIPYASYSLVVYDIHDLNNQVQTLTLGNTTYYTKSPGTQSAGYVDGNASTAYIYTQSSATTAATATANSDYVVFTGLSGAAQTFTVSSTGDFGEIEGFQIINTAAVPEPSTWAFVLAGAGLLGVGVSRRRRSVRA